jgi:uridine kinase
MSEVAELPRDEFVASIADLITALDRSHPVRLAVDGPDCAGKTILAEELAAALRERERKVIRASIDGFHRPRSERYRQGPESPLGYYEDSFDYRLLRDALLAQLGERGDRRYRTQVFDYRTDQPVHLPLLQAPADAILIFDGVFLLRPELVDAWDFRVFVSVDVDEIVRRARVRDTVLFGSPDEAERRYRVRYLPAQQHYLHTVRPDRLADVVIENDDPARPRLRVREARRR